jgi:hypothetical protein
MLLQVLRLGPSTGLLARVTSPQERWRAATEQVGRGLLAGDALETKEKINESVALSVRLQRLPDYCRWRRLGR